jgi:hypothetical protein
LRLLLETQTAGLAAHRRSDTELREMEIALDEMRQLTEQLVAGTTSDEARLLAEMANADAQFHIAIMTAAKNDLIRAEILRLHLVNRVIARSTSAAGGRVVGDGLMPSTCAGSWRLTKPFSKPFGGAMPKPRRQPWSEVCRDIIEQTLRIMARREREQLARQLT